MERANQVTLEQLLRIFKKSLLWMILVGVLLGCAAGAYGQFGIENQYTSKMTFRCDTSVMTTANVQMLEFYVTNTVMILDSQTVVERVVEKARITTADGGSAVNLMRNSTLIKGDVDSGIFTISVTCPDPSASYLMVRAYAELIPEVIVERGLLAVDFVDVPTEAPGAPSNSGRVVKYGLIGFVLGALIAFVVALVRFLFDVVIRSEEDLAEVTELPILGQIPLYSSVVETGEELLKK
ncbi:MAG: hypothetical protein IJZ37_00925 [Clostridia bacterium]|nr:hypothetical protein [Clostridia bacterium]MBQ8235229.1 hypothetical protein [Clostridia bacterium]MBQ8399163.1 hypothetical protein [Clostridia bacterium]